ncbi:MAG: ROK family protein, partial [bacterium]|nr:ROK family protein [bacterium]
EYQVGVARDSRCALGIFPGTGIGGACVYEGNILRGKNNTVMEIGHIPIMEGGPLCGCGQRGCLESVAGRLAVASEVAKAAIRGEAPSVFSKTGTDIRDIRSGALAKAVKDGEKIVKRILVDSARRIGVAAAGVVNLLAPDIIVLGGGLVEALPEIYVEEVADAAKSRVMPAYADSFKVVAAELGDNAAVIGAALWAKRQLAEGNAK